MICSSSCLHRTTPEPKCECLDACAPYQGERYDDCVDFCSYNREPIPLCMCNEKYTKARARRFHAFQVDPVSERKTEYVKD